MSSTTPFPLLPFQLLLLRGVWNLDLKTLVRRLSKVGACLVAKTDFGRQKELERIVGAFGGFRHFLTKRSVSGFDMGIGE